MELVAKEDIVERQIIWVVEATCIRIWVVEYKDTESIEPRLIDSFNIPLDKRGGFHIVKEG